MTWLTSREKFQVWKFTWLRLNPLEIPRWPAETGNNKENEKMSPISYLWPYSGPKSEKNCQKSRACQQHRLHLWLQDIHIQRYAFLRPRLPQKLPWASLLQLRQYLQRIRSGGASDWLPQNWNLHFLWHRFTLQIRRLQLIFMNHLVYF